MTPQSFGEKLLRTREKRRITLDQLGARTKIATSLLRGLEAGDCGRWPGGIYSRGFVRAYAEGVGLDPEQTVGIFIECYPAFAPPTDAVEEELPAESSPPVLLDRVKAVVAAIRTAALFRRA